MLLPTHMLHKSAVKTVPWCPRPPTSPTSFDVPWVCTPVLGPLCLLAANQTEPGPSGKPIFPINPRISICACHNNITSPGLISVSCAPSSRPQISTVSTIPVIYNNRPLCTREPQVGANPCHLRHLQRATANLPSTLSATHIHVDLLNARSLGNKSFLINELITDNKFDLFMIIKSWLTPADTAVLVEATPPDFDHLHLPWPCGRGGVLAVFLKKCFKCSLISCGNFKSFEVLCFFLFQALVLCCVF